MGNADCKTSFPRGWTSKEGVRGLLLQSGAIEEPSKRIDCSGSSFARFLILFSYKVHLIWRKIFVFFYENLICENLIVMFSFVWLSPFGLNFIITSLFPFFKGNYVVSENLYLIIVTFICKALKKSFTSTITNPFSDYNYFIVLVSKVLIKI